MKEPPSARGVYFHLQIFSLGVHLPLTQFMRNVLGHHQVATTQLSLGVWQTVLAFESLYCIYSPSTYGLDEFYYIYKMAKTKRHSNCGGLVEADR